MEDEATIFSSQTLAGQQGGGALYLVVQRAEVLEASKAGVGQADQDGKQKHQEGEHGEGSLQTWGQRDASLGGGEVTPGAGTVCGFSLRPKTKRRHQPPPSHHLQQLGWYLHRQGHRE